MADIFDDAATATAAPPAAGDIFDDVAARKPSVAPAVRGAGHGGAVAPLASAIPAAPAPPGPAVTSTLGPAVAPAAPASGPPSTITADKPSVWERMKSAFGRRAPQGSRMAQWTQELGTTGEPQLITPEAAMTPREREEYPEVAGLGEVAGSLTTPTNVALLAGTAGLGGLAGTAGRLAPRLVSGVFTAQMLKGAYEEFPAFRDALDRGDESEARRILAHLVASGALAYLSGHHAATGESLPLIRRGGARVSEPVRAEGPAAVPFEKSRAVPSAPGPRAEAGGGDIFDAVAARTPAPSPEGRSAAGDIFDVVGERGRAGPIPIAPEDLAAQGAELASYGVTPERGLSKAETLRLLEAPALPAGGEAAEFSSGPNPAAAAESARILSSAWGDRVARPFVDRVLKIGDKYVKAREADPEVAEGLHLLDNAPTYLRAKALQEVRNVVGDLSRPQERLFTLMADADARENLRLNHPEEYRQAESDPAVQGALARYRPLEQEVTRLREKLGGATLDQDYLRRVYEEHVAGVNKPEAPGDTERATSAFDRVIRPQKTDRFSREAEAEYHYQHGLHELGPAFATKFIATHLKALRDQVAHEFIDKATKLPLGAPEPRSIEYNGRTYYSPDVARDMREAGRKNVLEYGRYDPTAGEKFPTPVDGKFLGPRELTKVLTDFARRDESEPGGLRRFFQEQVIGFGFGIPHVFNILRRVSQGVPGGQANPEGWVRAWKVALDEGLRERGIAGLNDPGFDMLARRGAISTGEAANLKRYIGGNLNPANWARAVAKVGHKLLFEPGSFGGFGGLDQRARLDVADLVRSQRPDLSDSEIAAAVRTQLGDYNRANWTDRQKMLGRFMMWPGWDFASLRWVLQHPIRTTVPPALVVLLANRALGMFGANREEDRDDIGAVHIGDRDYSPSLLRESTARNLFRPVLAYAQSRMRGESNARAMDQAARGVTAGAGGLLNMLRPDLSGFLALATNRHQLIAGREIVTREDFDTPGRILPSLALEKQAEFTVRHALPALDRMLDSGDQDIDLRSFVGGNLGLPNYRDDAEKRLLRNAAEAERVYFSVSQLAKTKPEAARAMLKDPDNAVYALFHRDLAQMASVLHKIDQAKEAVGDSKLPKEEKERRLAEIEDARHNLLEHADGLNSVLFHRREQARTVAAPISAVAGRRPELAPPIQ